MPPMVWVISQPATPPIMAPLPPPYAPLPPPVAPPPYLPPPIPIVYQQVPPPYMPPPVPVYAPVPAACVLPTAFDECVAVPECAATGCPGLIVSQHGGRVRVVLGHYRAECDKVTGSRGERLVLEGNVRLVSQRHGQTLQIEGERVILNVKDEQFIVENARGAQQSRINVAPLCAPEACQAVTHAPVAIQRAECTAASSPCQAVQADLAQLQARIKACRAERVAYAESVEERMQEVAAGNASALDSLCEAVRRYAVTCQKEQAALADYIAILPKVQRLDLNVIDQTGYSAPNLPYESRYAPR
jgi:hypothetical protein